MGKNSDSFPEWTQPKFQFPGSTSGIEDENEAEQLLLQHRYLSECMGGVLPAALDLSHMKHALDAPCGVGGWMYELAWNYPSLQVMGVEERPAYVEKARELVTILGNVTVAQQDIRRLSDEIAPAASFDLVHARFLVSMLSPHEYPAVLTALVRRCRAGGLFVWDELEYPITNSPACQAFFALIQERLKVDGRAFSPGNPLGITALMSNWIQDAGCTVMLDVASTIEISSGTRGRDAFAWQMGQLSRQLRAFLLDAGVTSAESFDELCSQTQQEIAHDYFFGLIYVRTLVGIAI